MRVLGIGLLTLLCAPGSTIAGCDGVPDQINDGIDAGAPSSNAPEQCQTIVPQLPLLEAVELRVMAWEFPDDGVTLKVRVRQGGPEGEILDTTTAFVPGPLDVGDFDWYRFEFDACLELAPGETYLIELYDFPPSAMGWMYNLNGYPNGGWSTPCGSPGNEGVDFLFITYGAEAEVPATTPFGVALLAGVLLALGTLRLRRR